MISDYGIQPDSISEMRYLRYLYDSVGFSKGRLIYELPKAEDWLKSARDSSSTAPDYDQKDAEIIFTHLSKIGWSKIQSKYDCSKPWIENAKQAFLNGEIRAIVSDISDPDCLPIDKLSSIYPQWLVSSDIRIGRSYAEFQNALDPILKRAKRLKIVDPYFNPLEDRFMQFLRLCAHRVGNLTRVKIELHVDSRGCRSFGEQDFLNKWRSATQKSIGRRGNIEIYVVVWQEFANNLTIHDRYLLSHIGGVRIPRGVDIVGGHDKADISILSEKTYNEVYTLYTADGNNPHIRHIGTYKIY